MSGLVSRVIWIWPSWDKDLQKSSPKYESKIIQLGTFPQLNENNILQPYFCQCEITGEDEKNCTYININATKIEEQEITMSPESCQIAASYQSERINELHVTEQFKANVNWIQHTDHLILDIDEDFFGCESASKFVASDNASWEIIMSIDQLLKDFICPKHALHEDIADQFLGFLFKNFTNGCTRDGSRIKCMNSESTDDILVEKFRQNPSLFCGQNDFMVRNAWEKIAAVLKRTDQNLISRILDVGFCFLNSPKTLFFEEGRAAVTICHGLNDPNSTITFFHTPSEHEIESRIELLSRIISSVTKANKPNLVTVARSVRDGYTPRLLAMTIEDGLISMLQSVYGSWIVNYDDDLLGGKDGWNEWISRKHQT